MLAIRRHWKFFLTVFCFLSVGAMVRATSLIMETSGRGSPIDAWKPFVWEFSSTYVVLCLVPFVMMFDERYPIASKDWLMRILVHIPLSMVFSFVHIIGMVALRKLTYLASDEIYIFTDLNYTILYEYRKDVMAYVSILVVIYAYREILRLRHGEAQFEAAKADHSEDERILVSKAGIYKFLSPSLVNWVEAAGNYVELHVGDQTYMLRATMKEIESRLGNEEFARIHRSTIVKKNQIEQIRPVMNGDQNITLKDGTELRLSRRYRVNVSQGRPLSAKA